MFDLHWLTAYFAPNAGPDEDRQHKRFLRTLLIGSLVLTGVALLTVIIDLLRGADASSGTSALFLILVILIFSLLYLVSRTRYTNLASYILIAMYFFLATYAAYFFSTLLVQAWLLYVLVITMASALISIRFSQVITGLTAIALLILTYLEAAGIHNPDRTWTTELMGDDMIASILLLIVVTSLAWFSRSQIELSLKRARASEAALKQERDLLDQKVEERTRELQRAEAERLVQLYQFAAFGRFASGIFHDLANPLTAVSLSLEELKARRSSPDLNRAIEGTHRMQRFIKAARQQIQQQEFKTTFKVRDEIGQAVEVLSYKLKKSRLTIKLAIPKTERLHGNPVKFQQIIANLLNNAIDAYIDVPSDNIREIAIASTDTAKDLRLTVQDWGVGMPAEIIENIFQPFFTTKAVEEGTGIGLSIVKELVEKDFKGKVEVRSQPGTGTIFIITLPRTN